MSAPMDSDEDESFVTLGTPLEIYEEGTTPICVFCYKLCYSHQQSLQCDECNRWQHRICRTGISQDFYRKLMMKEESLPNWKCHHCDAASYNTAAAIFKDGQTNGGDTAPVTHLIPQIPDRPLSLLTLSPPSSPRGLYSPLPSSPLLPPPAFSSMSTSSEYSTEVPSPRLVLTPELVSISSPEDDATPQCSQIIYPELLKGSPPLAPLPQYPDILKISPLTGFTSPSSPLGFLTHSPLRGYTPQMSPPLSQLSTGSSFSPFSPDFSWPTPPSPLFPMSPLRSSKSLPRSAKSLPVSKDFTWPTPPSPLSPISPPLSPVLRCQTDNYGSLVSPVLKSFTARLDERVIDEAVIRPDEAAIVYTVLEKGTLQGKPRLVDNRGFSYCINTRRDKKIYWRCSVRSKACVCQAVVTQEGDRFVRGKKPHIHKGKPDEARRKPVSFQEQQATDSRGRPRFHGAFTGGFSAGFFNTVGSKEGFTPSTFVSSRSSKEEKVQQRPEDFMDDEDLGEHGIAPRKLATSATYTSEERGQKRKALTIAAAGTSVIPGVAAALTDLIVPASLPIGVRLLRKMGWKEGQGIGPRQRRRKNRLKKKVDTGKRTIGCALPPSDSSSEESDDETLKNVTFAPKDRNPISLKAKDNVHGVGYSGLDPKAALPSGHINLFDAPPVKGKGQKGIRGQAFGVGALEDDDADIYAVDHLSNYDMTMEEEDQDNRFGWTAPGQNRRGKQKVPIGYVGKLLEGFQLSSKPLKPKKVYPPPTLPPGFRPVHSFLKPCDSAPQQEKHNAISRGLMLGDTPIFKSVFDLMPKDDQKRVDKVKEASGQGILSSTPVSTPQPSTSGHLLSSSGPAPGPSIPGSAGSSVQDHSLSNHGSGQRSTRFSLASNEEGAKTPDVAMTTSNSAATQSTNQKLLFQGNFASFQPFASNSEKQKRYEQFLALQKQGKTDAYEPTMEGHMTEWEKEREREEFVKAAKMYKPLSAMMATRFTTAQYADDVDKADVPASDAEKSDQAKAAEMKMFGKLTRDEFEWHPDKLLCRRFNVPHPYPGSTIIGLPSVKRDKYSVFNFLDFASGPTNTAKADQPTPAPPAIEFPDSKPDEPLSKPQGDVKRTSFSIASKNRPALSSIFSVLYKDDEKQKKMKQTHLDQEKITDPVEQDPASEVRHVEPEPEEEKQDEAPTLDLFRAIFKNSDSEDSSSESEIEEPAQTDEPTSVERIASEKGEDITKSSSKDVDNSDISAKSSTTQYLPGAPVAMETISQRLSPETEKMVEADDDISYGPALPPPGAGSSAGPSSGPSVFPTVIDLTGTQHRKQKHKHKEKSKKHKKEKKVKVKKSKHKKERKKKKERRQERSSDDEDSDSSDSDDLAQPSDRKLLDKLKSVSGGRLKAADFM